MNAASAGRAATRVAAAIALAAITVMSGAGCQNLLDAPVPPPPHCPSGQHWSALPSSRYGCVADSGR